MSVIVPALDASRTIAACLDGLGAQRDAPAHEVLVVDNGSRDRTAGLAAAHPAVTRVLHEARRGSYAARNTGIAAATGQVLAFTDADCVPEPGWLAAGVAAIDAGAGLAGGAVVPVAGDPPTIWERYDAAVYLRQDELVEHDRFAATANLFVRRAVIDAVGAFDAALRSSGDYEFGRRATGAGHRLVYAPDARVGHGSRASLGATWRLHRRLGAGWRQLATDGRRAGTSDDPALHLPVGTVIDRAAAAGDRLRRREVLPVHALAMAARWTGRLSGRG